MMFAALSYIVKLAFKWHGHLLIPHSINLVNRWSMSKVWWLSNFHAWNQVSVLIHVIELRILLQLVIILQFLSLLYVHLLTGLLDLGALNVLVETILRASLRLHRLAKPKRTTSRKLGLFAFEVLGRFISRVFILDVSIWSDRLEILNIGIWILEQ